MSNDPKPPNDTAKPADLALGEFMASLAFDLPEDIFERHESFERELEAPE